MLPYFVRITSVSRSTEYPVNDKFHDHFVNGFRLTPLWSIRYFRLIFHSSVGEVSDSLSYRSLVVRLLHHYVHLAEIELVKPRNMAAFLSRVNLNTVMIYMSLVSTIWNAGWNALS